MCTVSMVAQDWTGRHPDWVPRTPFYPDTLPNNQPPLTPEAITQLLQRQEPVTREEFNALKAELEALRKLLEAAKRYDDETGQKDCEDPDKVALFKALAKLCGVDLSAVFAK